MMPTQKLCGVRMKRIALPQFAHDNGVEEVGMNTYQVVKSLTNHGGV